MRRLDCAPRPDWRRTIEAQGLTFHALDVDAAVQAPGQQPTTQHPTGRSYWSETACYAFSAAEIDEIEAASLELHARCRDAALRIAEDPAWLDRFGIPARFQAYVRRSLQRAEPSLYGRFDLAYDGQSPPKLLEYNADTPTTLIETAVIQWFWLQDRFPEADQFNSLHERLIERWREIGALMPDGAILHMSSVDDGGEDRQTVLYLQDVAAQAGLATEYLAIGDIGWHARRRRFVDLADRTIDFCFKLYPWEWLFGEAFAGHLIEHDLGFLEPPWKALLSNKAVLAVLWEMFPGHPNLLPASLDPTAMSGDVVVKPVLSREGANVELWQGGAVIARTGGAYGDVPKIYQRRAPLPCFDGNSPVIGSWIVGDAPAGMILREDRGPIITNASPVVPHLLRMNRIEVPAAAIRTRRAACRLS